MIDKAKEASRNFKMCGIVGIFARKTQIPPAFAIRVLDEYFR
jgi:hypothetical protein